MLRVSKESPKTKASLAKFVKLASDVQKLALTQGWEMQDDLVGNIASSSVLFLLILQLGKHNLLKLKLANMFNLCNGQSVLL